MRGGRAARGFEVGVAKTMSGDLGRPSSVTRASDFPPKPQR